MNLIEPLWMPGGPLAAAGVLAGLATALLGGVFVLWRVLGHLRLRRAAPRSGPERTPEPRTHPFVTAVSGTTMPDAEIARVAGIPRDLLPLVRASARSGATSPSPAPASAGRAG